MGYSNRGIRCLVPVKTPSPAADGSWAKAPHRRARTELGNCARCCWGCGVLAAGRGHQVSWGHVHVCHVCLKKEAKMTVDKR